MSAYATDIADWSAFQAALLRRVADGEQVNDQSDWENIAEEIDGLGKTDRREFRNRVATILLHLIKLRASPAIVPRAGWRETVRTQRAALWDVLQDSPGPRPLVSTAIREKLAQAKDIALASMADHGARTGVDPAGLNYTEHQVLGPRLPD